MAQFEVSHSRNKTKRAVVAARESVLREGLLGPSGKRRRGRRRRRGVARPSGSRAVRARVRHRAAVRHVPTDRGRGGGAGDFLSGEARRRRRRSARRCGGREVHRRAVPGRSDPPPASRSPASARERGADAAGEAAEAAAEALGEMSEEEAAEIRDEARRGWRRTRFSNARDWRRRGAFEDLAWHSAVAAPRTVPAARARDRASSRGRACDRACDRACIARDALARREARRRPAPPAPPAPREAPPTIVMDVIMKPEMTLRGGDETDGGDGPARTPRRAR